MSEPVCPPCWLLCVPPSHGSFHAATSCRYFYIPARKEHRGIGGLFFDDLEAEGAAYDVQAYVQVGSCAMGTTPLPCAGTCALQPGKHMHAALCWRCCSYYPLLGS